MPGTTILISGMPATGKSTFARWLGDRLCVPVLSYDRILRMLRSAGETRCGDLGYRFFLYELEEHRGTTFIADYISASSRRRGSGKCARAAPAGP